ncbi:MAG: TIGR03862 family flavoprotein [Ardenticatenaceae bacterium]|nr:TIGR03862 family flavoprotein [Ardenticatenaceae bacterium]MCB8946319.1 TIGR03862 family flavoprotein [Ardenticatenaceae bacterium]
MNHDFATQTAVVIGGGPAGLMAAEVLSQAGIGVQLFDAMPSLGRKFLLAGRGGLNLTHSEAFADFLSRYGDRRPFLEPILRQFTPTDLRHWVQELGFETFVGSSGRVFPTTMKASPLLRAWLRRLEMAGVVFHLRHRWLGWAENGALRLAAPDGEKVVTADAVILALGGGSWPRMGSDGAWMPLLMQRGIPVADFQPSNCGFHVAWSEHFRSRFAGEPVKTVCLTLADGQDEPFAQRGEFVVTQYGVEGSLVYAASARLREEIYREGTAVIHLDLLPDQSEAQVRRKLAAPRGSQSLSNHLRRAGIHGVKAGLLREYLAAEAMGDAARVAAAAKALPLTLLAPRPLAEAISSAGGVLWEAVNGRLMLRDLPGVFVAGEMLDWEAPTGGYLLTACFASGRVAGQGAVEWLTGD